MFDYGHNTGDRLLCISPKLVAHSTLHELNEKVSAQSSKYTSTSTIQHKCVRETLLQPHTERCIIYGHFSFM